MENNLKNRLKSCSSLKEIIEVMDQEYNLDQPLGPMAKGAVVAGMSKVLKVTQIKKR